MDFAQFAFDRVEAIEKAKTPSAVLIELSRAGAEFGLDRFLTAGFPAPAKGLAPYILMHNWAPGWFERYVANNYHDLDPVLRKLRSTVMPLAWTEAPYEADREPLAHKVMTEATEFGLRAGYCVPIYTVSGDQAGMTFGGERFEDSADARRALHLIAIYGHYKAHELSLARRRKTLSHPRLSPREIEVLKWCSAGKTTQTIAEILSLSEHTIETYVASACRKLDSVNRTQAVAQAIRARLIP